MTSSKPDFGWAAKIRTSTVFCLVGAVTGTGLYFGNLVYVSAGDEAASPLTGLSLTKYCSNLGAQGYTVAGTDCVQPINLDAACDFEYQTTALKHRFTSSDPDSATCYNPATHMTYGGISNMTGYCTTLTATAGVIATATNLDYKNTWVCQVAIDMNSACDTQNNRANMMARQVNGAWMCYGELPPPGSGPGTRTRPGRGHRR
jgi:hypothetical protein